MSQGYKISFAIFPFFITYLRFPGAREVNGDILTFSARSPAPIADFMRQGEEKGVRVRRREAGGELRMQESYKVRPSQSPWPRVMRVVGQPAGRSVHRGTTGLCMELRTHLSAVADLVLTRGRQ